MDKTDHTAAIFAALGITPKGQPWAYPKYRQNYNDPIFLLSGTLESDGLAVRLVEIAYDKNLISVPIKVRSHNYWICASEKYATTNYSFAAAVHAALCEALGIKEEEKV